MKRIFFYQLCVLMILLTTIESLSAQYSTGNERHAQITGRIIDAETGEPLPAVQINNVYRDPRKDSIVVKIYTADVDGKFSIMVPRVEQNRLELICLGYKFFEKSLVEIPLLQKGNAIQYEVRIQKDRRNQESTLNRPIDLGDLKMEPDVQKLDEVVVRSRIRLYEMSGDTTIIFPRIVKVGEGEPLIELMRRHPMFDVQDNGDVFFDGKLVERVKLNEKLLFGEDARTAVQTLLAKDAHLIKAYEEIDEKDEILQGSEHARRRQVLDIISFRDFDKIENVQIALERGVDKEKGVNGKRQDRYFAGITGGVYNDRTRISLNAKLDNCPNILGKTQSTQENRLYNRTGEGGITIEKSRPDLLNKFSIGYHYENIFSNDQQESLFDFYPTIHFQTQLQENFTQNSMNLQRHRLNMNGSFTQRKNRSISFGLFATLSDNENESSRLTHTIQDGVEISGVENQTLSDRRSYNVLGNIDYSKNMNKWGNLQLYVTIDHSQADHTSFRIDSTNSNGNITYDVLDMDGQSPNTLLNAHLFYTHPKLRGAKYSSKLEYRNEQSERLYVNRFTHQVDNLMSEDIDRRTLRFQNRWSYSYNSTNHFLQLEMQYELVKLIQDEMLPTNWNGRSTFHLFNPFFSYEYRKGRTSFSVGLDAGNSYIPPNLADFSPRLDIDNPMFVRGGNPNLKIPNRYGFSIRLNLPINLRYSFRIVHVKNGIVWSNTYYAKDTYLPEYDYHILGGAMIQRPVNSDYQELTTSLNYSRMLGLICNLKTSLAYNFSNPEATYDNRMGRIKNQSGNWNLKLHSNFSNSLFLTLENRLALNRYVNVDGFTNKGIMNKTNLKLEWDITYRFFVKSNYIYTHRHSTMLERDINEQVLNASVGVKLFSHQGKLTFNAFDILNDQSNILNSANDIYVQTTYKPLNTSFFTVCFEYRFSNQ